MWSFKLRWSNTLYYLANCKANKPHYSGENVIANRLQFLHRVHTSYEALEYMWSVEFSAFSFYCLKVSWFQRKSMGDVWGGRIGVRWPECFHSGILFLKKEQVDMRWMEWMSFAQAEHLDGDGLATPGAYLYDTVHPRCCSSAPWNVVVLIKKKPNKPLLIFSRQCIYLFFSSIFFHFKVTNKERGVQNCV